MVCGTDSQHTIVWHVKDGMWDRQSTDVGDGMDGMEGQDFPGHFLKQHFATAVQRL